MTDKLDRFFYAMCLFVFIILMILAGIVIELREISKQLKKIEKEKK